MKLSIIKKNNKSYLPLPEDFIKISEIEFFQLKKGYYLITPVLEAKKEKSQNPTGKNLTPAEQKVLKQLFKISFEKRVPPYVKKVLREEYPILTSLQKKGYITLITSRKYPKGVFNIPNKFYPLIKKLGQSEKRERTYYILKNEGEAKEISRKLEKELKNKEFLGTKGFDGTFYIVKSDYFNENSSRLLKFLTKEINLRDLSKLSGLAEEQCNVIVQIMLANGDVIESKKGYFRSV